MIGSAPAITTPERVIMDISMKILAEGIEKKSLHCCMNPSIMTTQ